MCRFLLNLFLLLLRFSQCKSFDSKLDKCDRNNLILLRMDESKQESVSTESDSRFFHFIIPPEQKAVQVNVDSEDDKCMSFFARQPQVKINAI